MVLGAPQVTGKPTDRRRLAATALIGLWLIGCEAPARVKPWRHAPNPTDEAAAAVGSPVLAGLADQGPTGAEVHGSRAHTLRVHLDADPGRLTPVVEPSTWARRITVGPIFEPLLRYVPGDAQDPARYTGRLARSWRVAPSGLEIRVELQPGVTFHDGRTLSAVDVQFTLDTLRDPRRGISHLRPMLDDIETVELVASHELRIRLKRPSGWVLRALAEVPILPAHVYDGSLHAGGALVGTGPWRLASNKGGVVKLVRHDGYWGTRPTFDVELVYQPDAAVALTAAKRGELDIVPALIPAHWPEQAGAPGLAASFRPLELAPPRLRYFAFNAARPMMGDARVRHALALLIDRRSIAKRAFDGLARPVLWPIWPGGPVDGPEVPAPDFDPAAAGRLLDAAGWLDTDKDGIRDQGEGKQLRLVLIGLESPPSRDAAGPPAKSARDYFVEAARRVGVIVEVKASSEAQLAKRLAEGAYDLVEMAFSGRVDMDLAPLVGGKLPERPVQPRVDRVLDAMGASWDPAARGKLAPELAAALAESWPIAGIIAEAPQGLVHRRLQGVRVWDGWIDLTQLHLAE
jgi:peptide/nickel transport system substrate-binding protein